MDRDRRVLLVHFDFVTPQQPSGLWACPGGGIDDTESVTDSPSSMPPPGHAQRPLGCSVVTKSKWTSSTRRSRSMTMARAARRIRGDVDIEAV